MMKKKWKNEKGKIINANKFPSYLHFPSFIFLFLHFSLLYISGFLQFWIFYNFSEFSFFLYSLFPVIYILWKYQIDFIIYTNIMVYFFWYRTLALEITHLHRAESQSGVGLAESKTVKYSYILAAYRRFFPGPISPSLICSCYLCHSQTIRVRVTARQSIKLIWSVSSTHISLICNFYLVLFEIMLLLSCSNWCSQISISINIDNSSWHDWLRDTLFIIIQPTPSQKDIGPIVSHFAFLGGSEFISLHHLTRFSTFTQPIKMKEDNWVTQEFSVIIKNPK